MYTLRVFYKDKVVCFGGVSQVRPITSGNEYIEVLFTKHFSKVVISASGDFRYYTLIKKGNEENANLDISNTI